MTDPFPWSDVFAVGHADLDSQHRQLVDLIDQFCAAARRNEGAEGLRAHLSAITQATRTHLIHENAVLCEIKLGMENPSPASRKTPRHLGTVTQAAIDDHISEHPRLLDHLITIARGLCGGDEINKAAMCADLKAWFLDHAIKHDAHLKAVFQAM